MKSNISQFLERGVLHILGRKVQQCMQDISLHLVELPIFQLRGQLSLPPLLIVWFVRSFACSFVDNSYSYFVNTPLTVRDALSASVVLSTMESKKLTSKVADVEIGPNLLSKANDVVIL